MSSNRRRSPKRGAFRLTPKKFKASRKECQRLHEDVKAAKKDRDEDHPIFRRI